MLHRSLALLSMLLPIAASAQPAPPDVPALQQMAGHWTVASRMWKGPGMAAEEQPAAAAVRTVPPGGGFVAETLSGEGGGKPFTRTATLNYNAAERVFEYASMDTRAPQLMHYRSAPAGPAVQSAMRLAGGQFLVPEWGKWRNARFAYRIELSPVQNDRQTLRIFFKPLTAPVSPEFLATQYDYSRRGG